jgi:hypothetical protein
MPANPGEDLKLDDLVDAAREIIRNDDGVVSIDQLLDGLGKKFGERFPITSPDVTTVLWLIQSLWQDPHIHQVPDGYIEFGWMG